MRALVTGARGFLGQHLCRVLTDSGVDVLGVGRGAPREWYWGWRQMDVLDAVAVSDVVSTAAPDLVFHLASPQRSASLALLLDVLLIGTSNILTAVAAHARSARIVVVGSSAEYGAAETASGRIDEATCLQPTTDYGVVKAAQGHLALAKAAQWNLNLVYARLFNLTGPGEPPSLVVAAVAQQLAAVESGRSGSVIRVGRLDTVRDFLDVRDAALALNLLGTDTDSVGIVNVCSGQGTAIRDIVTTLMAHADAQPQIECTAERMIPGDVRAQIGNPTWLMTCTQFKPTYRLVDSLGCVLDEAREAITADRVSGQ